MFSNYFIVFVRYFASLLVDSNETGKTFGIIALLEFLVLLISSSLISLVYHETVASLPALIYLICIGIILIILIPISW